MITQERRFVASAELRAVASGELRQITGRPAIYNSRSELINARFRETIAPGAATTALKTSDIRALFNHDPNFVIARQSAGTLSVTEDRSGLSMAADPPPTQWARDLLVSIERRDVTQMSFGFIVGKGNDDWQMEDGVALRTINRFAEILDVSPVTFPAYPDTSVAVRSLDEWAAAAVLAVDPPPAILRELRRRRHRLIVAL